MPIDPFETMLELVTVSELREQRQRYLDEAEELRSRADAIDRLLAIKERGTRDVVQNGATGTVRLTELVREAERPGLADAILRGMNENPDAAWKADAILSHLVNRGWAPAGKTPKNSIAATLSRLAAMGEVERVGHGEYRLAAHKRQASLSAATEGEALHLPVGEGGEPMK